MFYNVIFCLVNLGDDAESVTARTPRLLSGDTFGVFTIRI